MRGGRRLARLALVCALALCGAAGAARAQQQNPVERKVQNPITDAPSVNPLEQIQPIRTRLPVRRGEAAASAADELIVDADRQSSTGKEGARVVVYEGSVDAKVGIYRLQADKLTVYEATNKVVAEGAVVFDQGELQRITGTRAEFNYVTKLGFFVNSTGFTNQTEDGTVIYFKADSVERVAANKIVIINGEVTACDEENPKWSFTSKRATITSNDRVRAHRPAFRVKGVPVLPLPFVSVSIKKRDRASGFLTPTFSGSGKKGFRISNAYYQTLGRSADVTLRNDIFTGRGVGIGADVRTLANSRSYLYFGFYTVKDRIFGAKASPTDPDQGGTSFYADGVHYFPNGFVAAADVNITSSLPFRQVFSDDVQSAISPEERSQLFLNKNSDAYTFNALARSQVTSIPSARIRIRQLPGINYERRPSPLDFIKKLPVYFSFDSGLEGVSRKETVTDEAEFARLGGTNALVTPSIVQRLRVRPQVSVPLHFGGWDATATAALDGVYYSNSVDPATRLVLPANVTRAFAQLEFDVRPPALARDFRRGDGSLRFRHVVEPYAVYRKIAGVGRNDRVIRFDYLDAVADTNEIEFGLTNRLFTRRSTENVSGSPPAAGPVANGAAPAGQPYETFSLTVRGKYFFDPDFGGALVPGRRNQFFPINTFSGFTYGGVPRRFSPLNVEARYRPRAAVFADVRTDLDVSSFGVRNLGVSFGVSRRLVQAFTTFYYTRAVSLAPSLARYADAAGKEPGTLKGAQWSPTIFLGEQSGGLFGGASFFFDFQNRPNKNHPLVSSVVTLGYTWDCCNITVQNFTYNIGLRRENRAVFSFRLNGIGTFGTQQIGQQVR